MVNVKKRKGRVVIDSDSEDSASDDNLDQVGHSFSPHTLPIGRFFLNSQQFWMKLADANGLRCVWPRSNKLIEGPSYLSPSRNTTLTMSLLCVFTASHEVESALGSFTSWKESVQSSNGCIMLVIMQCSVTAPYRQHLIVSSLYPWLGADGRHILCVYRPEENCKGSDRSFSGVRFLAEL